MCLTNSLVKRGNDTHASKKTPAKIPGFVITLGHPSGWPFGYIIDMDLN